MKHYAAIICLVVLTAILPARGNEVGLPEGWATCSTVYSADDYDLTGGGDGSLIVLRNDGSDMRQAIYDAVCSHDVIVFDGVNGDFVMSAYLSFQSLEGKTLIGVNGACLRTEFQVTEEIRKLLDDLDVNSLSQNAADNLGGTLSNGIYVAEQSELTIRQALIDRFGDQKEPYRNAGVFAFYGCSNLIFRNLDFAGPGSMDVGGADLLTLAGCDHVWVDHCRFTDGLDGNLDIINNSDFVTVSDTHFRYTALSYNHPLSNLNSGTEITDGSPQKNNVSWIRCLWDEGCLGRMPYTTLGTHHILNCYWYCSNGTCIDAHNLSRILIEQSFFSSRVRRALAVRDENVRYEWRGSLWAQKVAPVSNATVEVPYSYSVIDVMSVPDKVRGEAGVTLADPFTRSLCATPSSLDFGQVYANNQLEGKFNVSAFGGEVPSRVTLTAPDGVLLSESYDGDYTSVISIDATDENLFQADVYFMVTFSGSGRMELPIVASASDGHTFIIPVTADVVGLSGERIETSLVWPFDMGLSGSTEAVTDNAGVFSLSAFTLGEKINIHSGQRIGSHQFTLFNPTEAISKTGDEECSITFDVVTASDFIFIPKKLKLKAARVGTDMCLIDIDCGREQGGGDIRLLTSFQPVRSSESPYYSEVELPLGNAGIGESFHVRIRLYNMTANKQLALSDVTIEGDAYAVDSGLDVISQAEDAGVAEYYDLLGRRIFNPQSGKLYIRRGSGPDARLVIYK